MKLIDVEWAPRANILLIECRCGNKFTHKVNRVWVRCPTCGNRTHIDRVRGQRLDTN